MKKRGTKYKIIQSIIVLSISFFWCANLVMASDTLTVRYYDNFDDFAHLDDKYKQIDRYLVYKYLSFRSRESIDYVDVGLGFIVDKSWYNNNRIEDIFFLRYNNGSWTKIPYDSKTNYGEYFKYNLKSSNLGEYWAIVGVLPYQKNTATGDFTLKTKKDTHQKVDSGFDLGAINFLNDKFSQILSSLKGASLLLEKAITIRGASIIVDATAATALALLLASLDGPIGLFITLKQIIFALAGLFFKNKKIRGGIVYDVSNGHPISLARVDVIDKETQKIKVTKFTDRNGKYYFLVPKGDYLLQVKKKNYKILTLDKTHLIKRFFNKKDISTEIKFNEEGIIQKNVALIKEADTAMVSGVWATLKFIFKYLFKGIFIFGIILSTWICIVTPTVLNFVVLAVYVLIILFRLMFAEKVRYGVVVGQNNKPEAFAVISVTDAKTNKLVAREITDTKGRYYILLDKGNYFIKITTTSGVSAEQQLHLADMDVLAHKLRVINK